MALDMYGTPSGVYVPLGSGTQYVADSTGFIAAVATADIASMRAMGCEGKAVLLAAAALGEVITVAGRSGAVVLTKADITDLGTVGTAAAKAASDGTKASVASVNGATSVNHAAKFADIAGTVADGGVLGTAAALSLVTGFAKHALVAGGAAGNITVTGIKTTDTLNMVLHIIGAGTTVTDVTDLTAEFTISATSTINNTGHTDTTGNKLLVLWTATT